MTVWCTPRYTATIKPWQTTVSNASIHLRLSLHTLSWTKVAAVISYLYLFIYFFSYFSLTLAEIFACNPFYQYTIPTDILICNMLSLLLGTLCLFYVISTRANNHSMANENLLLFLGKSRPAAVDETVYSQVKPGSPLGNNEAIK